MRHDQAAHEEAIVACMHPRDLPAAAARYRARADALPASGIQDAIYLRALLGYALARMGDTEGALFQCREIMRLSNSRRLLAAQHFRAAGLLDELGRRDEARTEYSRAAELRPECFIYRRENQAK